MNTRTRTAVLAAGTALATLGALGTATDAHAATSGPGWKLAAHHIDTAPWQIAFHDTTSRSRLTGYSTKAAAELTMRLGVKFTVTTRIVPATPGKCAPSHVITLRWTRSPDPAHPDRSYTSPCRTRSGAAYSAALHINSVYWDPSRRFSEPTRMNVIWHEYGHAVGLTHPDTCPKNRDGLAPLMCSGGSNGAYRDTRSRRYTSWEQTGFAHLIAHRPA